MLLERERELHVVEQALDRLGDGQGSLLMIEGPAGIGKTRLLGEAADFARQRGFLVRVARGGEIEREMPFGVARQLFEPLVERASEEERSRLLSGSARLALLALGRGDPDAVGSAGDPLAPIHGLYWLVANLADRQPLALAMDDTHWADPQTLRFLDYLARRLAELPVLVVATVRTGEPAAPAEIKQLRLEAEVVQLQTLTPSAVRELIALQLGHDLSNEFVDACARATGGNPFLLSEILRTLRADGIAPDCDAAKSIGGLGPENVAQQVLVRLGRFGAEAVGLAQAVAVLGGAPQLRHAAGLAGLEEERARTLCDQLREAEILSSGLPIDFVHPLVRQAIYRDLSEGQRSAMHGRAARILASTGTGARDVAPHLMACSPNGDQWVVSELREAAAEATAAGAHDAGITYLERALKEPAEDELPVLFELGRALLRTDPFRAPQVLSDVAERGADAKLRVDGLRVLSLAYLHIGNAGEAARASSEALTALADGDPELALWLEAQLYLFSLFAKGGDVSTSERLERVAAGIPARTSGQRMVREALAVDRFMACAPVSEVVGLALPFPPLPWELDGIGTPVPGASAKVLASSGRWDDARAAIVGWTEAAQASGKLVSSSWWRGFLAEIDRIAGRLVDSEAEARTAWEIATALGGFSAFGWSARMNLLATLIARGDLDRAAPLAENIPLSLGPREIPANPWPIEIRASLRLAEGDLHGAVEDLLSFGDTVETLRFLNPAYPTWRQDAAPALAAVGRTTEAAELIAVAEDRARAFGAPHVIGAVLRARGLVEPRRRQINTLEESVSALQVYGPPHELARSLVELGAALRRNGQRSEARESLRRALELAHRCGAGGVEERAREELAAAGSRPRTAVRTGFAALTASELRTARLAAEGLSNPEIAQRLFVTRRTVETHLSHVYEKLGISGRAGLRGALAEPSLISR